MWILGISRHHNGAACLLHDGKIIFYLEEERLSRIKHDGFCVKTLEKIKEFTNKLDYVALSGYDPLDRNFEWMNFSAYGLLLIKQGLINSEDQIIDLTNEHHLCHAACGFYNSGFDSAVTVIIDGAGSAYELENGYGRETSTIISAAYPDTFKVEHKNVVSKNSSTRSNQYNVMHTLDIGKAYQTIAVLQGFDIYDCGKTMGLASYGQYDPNIPSMFIDGICNMDFFNHDRTVNVEKYPYVDQDDFQVQANMAWAIQESTQQIALDLIKSAVANTGNKNVVFTGGYALNCTANYFIRKNLDKDIDLYIEPISHDGGTAIGAAKLIYHNKSKNSSKHPLKTLFLGPLHNNVTINLKNNEKIINVNYKELVKILREPNIIAVYWGGSEAGPRALGHRSIVFDPTVVDGKDRVNFVKRREHFRPFAASVLVEKVHEWFDLAGMKDSPFMMYAVDALPGVAEKVPSVIHVDNTCRIQTVDHPTDGHFYELIKEFYQQTKIPMLFNTSFNLAGEPLVETIDDALKTVRTAGIKYLWLPNAAKLVVLS